MIKVTFLLGGDCMTMIIAHRGSAGTHPENTMDAFIAAEKYGADGVELDVQLSLDGEVVVIHDTTLDRTTSGTGRVKDFTLSELKALKANYHYKHFLNELHASLHYGKCLNG
ncbi:glycerophosphodiester phosphodiesterase family protein [Bacillus sp. N9]